MSRATCDMRDCHSPVTHIDEKGFVYCAHHGAERRQSGRRCRRMRADELEVVRRGEPIRGHYDIRDDLAELAQLRKVRALADELATAIERCRALMMNARDDDAPSRWLDEGPTDLFIATQEAVTPLLARAAKLGVGAEEGDGGARRARVPRCAACGEDRLVDVGTCPHCGDVEAG